MIALLLAVLLLGGWVVIGAGVLMLMQAQALTLRERIVRNKW